MQSQPAAAKHKLIQAAEIGEKLGLKYVYSGDISYEGMNTACQQIVIRRKGFSEVESFLQDGRYPTCDAAIPGIHGHRKASR